MKNDQNFNHKQTLYALILQFAALGCAIIPTLGKQPGVQWKVFQRYAPSLNDLDRFFNPQRTTGYDAAGIITGRVSGLVVLDFDTHDAFYAFQKKLPDLTRTHIVRTRRGFHVYLRVPDRLDVPRSRSLKDLDVQGPGRYVIMQGSKIDGYVYERQLGPDATADDQRRPIQFYEVTATDLDRLEAYFARLPGRKPEITPTPPPIPERPPSPPPVRQKPADVPEPSAAPDTPPDNAFTVEQLQNAYRRFAPEFGRNNTLFYMACQGRDSGFSLDEMKTALTDLHIYQAPPSGHRRETPAQRRREAHHTITSAFSYRRRAIRQRVLSNPDQLSNIIREALLRQKNTNVVRLLEGLRLKGITPGQPFTERDALEMLDGTVGRHSVRAAITALADVLHPSPRPPLPNADGVAAESSLRTEPLCKRFGVQKPDKKSPRGCPPQVYVMPSNRELARWLGVKDTFVRDQLSLDDLKTAKKTRQALHRRFIERKPGTYSHSLMQIRLGVCRRTVQNYNAEDPDIICMVQYRSTPLDWSNFKYAMPDEAPHPGCFIEDKNGNRYPYQQKIVVELLKKRQEPRYCRQIANHYRYRTPLPVIRRKIQVEEPSKPPPPRVFHMPEVNYIEVKPPTKLAKPMSKQGKTSQNPQSPLKRNDEHSSSGEKAKQRPDRESYREPLPDEVEEAVAQRVREQINAMTEDPKDCVTLVAMRRLVWRHRAEPVVKSLAVVRKRRNVRKPIGLLSTLLRCGDYR